MKSCPYATIGCNYANDCVKAKIKECGYYKYFLYLDKAFKTKEQNKCVELLQND